MLRWAVRDRVVWRRSWAKITELHLDSSIITIIVQWRKSKELLAVRRNQSVRSAEM